MVIGDWVGVGRRLGLWCVGTAGGCCDGNPVKSQPHNGGVEGQVLPLSRPLPPCRDRQARGGMEPAACGPLSPPHMLTRGKRQT